MLALVNGGAAVALLAYLGNLASRQGVTRPSPNMTWPLVCFSGGLVLTVVAFIFSYLTQITLYKDDRVEAGFMKAELDMARAVLIAPNQKRRSRMRARIALLPHTFFLWIAFELVVLAALAFAAGCVVAALIFAN